MACRCTYMHSGYSHQHVLFVNSASYQQNKSLAHLEQSIKRKQFTTNVKNEKEAIIENTFKI